MVFLWCFISFYSIAASSILQDCTFSANLPLDVPWLQLHCELANVADCNHGMLNTLARPQLEAAGNARVMFSTSRTEYQGSCQSRLIVNFYLLIVSYSQITYHILSYQVLFYLILYLIHYIISYYIIFFRPHFSSWLTSQFEVANNGWPRPKELEGSLS